MAQHRRPGFLLLAVTITAAASAPAAHAQEPTPCAPVLVGTWKPETTSEANPIFLAFSADGWVNLLDSSGGGSRAADFGIMAQARYALDVRGKPPRVHFTTQRGNDVFPPGSSSWPLEDFGDGSFTTVNGETGAQSRWVRVQTHRHFLTFVAGAADLRDGGLAFAMWTRIDGRNTELEALGQYAARSADGRPTAVFGRIPAALANAFATEHDNDGSVMMRLELSDAEYHRTHKVFDRWIERLRNRTLPPGDPYTRSLEFLEQTAGTLNQCGPQIAVTTAGAPPAPAASDADRRREPSHFVRRIRQMNRTRHLADGMFPFVWEPPPPL